jgi:hypothetical protein
LNRAEEVVGLYVCAADLLFEQNDTRKQPGRRRFSLLRAKAASLSRRAVLPDLMCIIE